MSTDEKKLSKTDRLILANQYRILEKVDEGNSSNYKEKRIIVEAGYELHYDELYSCLSDRVLSEEDSLEVMDILDMYRAINYSYKKLSDKEGLNKHKLEFEGFDGNNNYRYLDYARYLVNIQDRWGEILDERPNFDFNSHSNNLDVYRRMLDTWFSLGKKHDLSKEEIILIVDSRIHPENLNG